jgi:histidine triad (HIT) family protein
MSCIFCKIANGEIKTSPVYEDDDVMAFDDLKPQAPVHVLVIPKEHIESMGQLSARHKEIAAKLMLAIPSIAEKKKVGQAGYRLVVNSGKDAGQEVMHLHVHMLAGRKFQWPPG